LITNKENIADAFSAFHDGNIIFEKEKNSNQIWKIDCEYLARMINPKFKFFWIKIYQVKSLQFDAWMNPFELPKEIWTNTQEVFKAELEISSAQEKNNKIVISCNQHDSDFNFLGGELFFDCESIEVFDEKWNKIEENELGEICNKY
jgi:hypothetical protein